MCNSNLTPRQRQSDVNLTTNLQEMKPTIRVKQYLQFLLQLTFLVDLETRKNLAKDFGSRIHTKFVTYLVA